jgi:hypothetical protein
LLVSVSGNAALFKNNAFVWPLHTHAPLRTLPFHSGPILDYVVPSLVILLTAPLIPFIFGGELEFLFAVNTDAVAQDPTHFLSPHTDLGSNLASKPSARLLSTHGLQTALRKRLWTAVAPQPSIQRPLAALVQTRSSLGPPSTWHAS